MMRDLRPMAFSRLSIAVRYALFAGLALSSSAWAQSGDAVAADAPPAAAADQTSPDERKPDAEKPKDAAEANKPSLMGEIKVVGYQTSSATSATGVVTAIIDTPISISAINSQFLSDVNASQAMQAIGSLTGVTGQANSGETLTNFAVRGYKVMPQVDGFDSLAIVSGLGSTVGIDRIEVLKGPSAVFNGNVPPGGSLNIIYKKPRFDSNLTYIEGEVGSWDYRSGEFFSSGPIGNDFAYLVNLYKKNSDGWVDWTGQDEKTAILGVTARPIDGLSVNVNYRRIENDAQISTLPVTHEGFIGSGLPQDTPLTAWVASVYGPNEPPYTTTVPSQYLPGGVRYNVLGPQNYNKETLNFWSTEMSYAVNEHVEIRDSFARSSYTWGLLGLLQSGALAIGPSGDVSTFLGSSGLLTGSQEGTGWENKLEAAFYFDTGPISHSMLVGYQASNSWTDSFKVWVGPGQVNSSGQPWNFFTDGPLMLQDEFDALRRIFPNPNYLNQKDVPGALTHAYYVAEQMSMYDDRLHVLLGARHTETANGNLESSDTTPQIGILGKPFSPDSFFADTAFFVNYSKSFTPSGLVQPGTTEVVPPAKGTGKEIGVKTAWLDGQVTSTISLFRDDLENIATPDYSEQGQGGALVKYNLGGVGRAQGMEAELTWLPSRNLQLSANFTNLAVAKYTRYPGVPQQMGLRFPSTPAQQANLTAKYSFDEGSLSGLYLGGWIHGQTKTRGTIGSDWHYGTWLPGLVQVSGFVGYKIDHFDVRLNIENLTDRGGYVMNNVMQPQSPRAYYLTAKYTL